MSNVINVCDVGARYGIHPSWKGLENFEILFHLVEADTEEAARLQRKLLHDRGKNSFRIYDVFLGPDSKRTAYYQLSNRAMSGSFRRKPSRLFMGERASQVKIDKTDDVVSVSLDRLFDKVTIDFLKIDTEGSEFQILLGAENMLKNSVIGIRAEVAMNEVFYDAPVFSKIDEFLKANNFDLLTFEFSGKGDLQHQFVNPEQRFGVLNLTDAIWLHKDFTCVPFTKPTSVESLIRTLKAVVFTFSNHCPDLGLAILSESRQTIKLHYKNELAASLLAPLSRLVEHHLYSLKWLPGQNIEEHSSWFRDTFLREMRTGTDFMSALDLNP